MNVLEARNITVAFPKPVAPEDAEEFRDNPRYVVDEQVVLEKVVDNVSFDLKKGEVLGLVGESGSGKSLTAHVVANLLFDKAPSARLLDGSVMFDGKDLLKVSDKEMRRRYRGKRISTIFQDAKGTFNPVTSVGPQIAEMFRMHKGMSRKEAKAAAIELLELARISNPQSAYDKVIGQLSGGEAQRANIAMMALATMPDILIADEATTALDATVQAQTLDYLMNVVKENGISLIFITHDFGLIAEYADRMVVLNSGAVVEQGTVQDIFENPETEFVRNILDKLPRMDRKLRQFTSPEEFTEAAVRVSDTAVKFPEKEKGLMWWRQPEPAVAVHNATLDIHKGEILGVVGESGSGKTTLMRTVLNLLPDESIREGSVEVLGEDVYAKSEKELRKLRRAIGGVPQASKQSLTPRVRISGLVGEALDIHGMYQAETLKGKDKEKRERSLEMLRMVELPAESTISKFPSQLSGGEQQRVSIARALMTDPDILLLDEPTASLDASKKNAIMELLVRLHAEKKLTLVLISHELHTIASVCDRVVVMWRGRIVEVGTPQDVFGSPAHPYTRILVSSMPVPDPAKAREQRRKRQSENLVMPSFAASELQDLENSILTPVNGSGHHMVDAVTKELFTQKIA